MTESLKSGVFGKMLSLKDEQERVQKKTFTKWINSYLSQLNPPVIIKDVFLDFKDGLLLLDLLELLTKSKLRKEKPKGMARIHCITNVKTALEYMQIEKKIKMVNINPSDIVDGKPAIVLGLIWTLILFFQIEEQEEFLLHALGLDNDPGAKVKGMAKKALMAWSNNTLSDKYGLNLKDFGDSWRDGNAFNALVHNINPDLIDLEDMKNKSNKERLENAFNIAENQLGIPKLLDSEDVDVSKPDEKSIMTYVAQFLKSYPEGRKTTEDSEDTIDAKIGEKEMATASELSDIDKLKEFNENVNIQSKDSKMKKDYDVFSRLMDEKKVMEETLENMKTDGDFDNDIQLKDVKEAWLKSEIKLKNWQWDLDKILPEDVANWLHEAENYLMNPLVNYNSHDIDGEIKNKRKDHKRIYGAKDEILRNLKNIEKNPPPAITSRQLENLQQRVNDIFRKEPEKDALMNIFELQVNLNEEADKWNKSLDSWETPIKSKIDFEQRMAQFNASTDNGNPMENFKKGLNELIAKTCSYFKENPHLDPDLNEFLKNALESCESKNDVLPSKFDFCCQKLEHLSSEWQQIDDVDTKIQDFQKKMESALKNGDTQQQRFLAAQLPEIKDLLSTWEQKFEQELKPHCSDELIRDTEKRINGINSNLENIEQEVLQRIEKQKQVEARQILAAKEVIIKDLETNSQDIFKEVNTWFNEIENCLMQKLDASTDKLHDMLNNLEGLNQRSPKIEDLIENGYRLADEYVKQNSPEEAAKLRQMLDDVKKKFEESVTKKIPKNKDDINYMINLLNDLEVGIKELDELVEEGNAIQKNLANESNSVNSSKIIENEKEFVCKEAEIADSVRKDKELLKKLKEKAKNSSLQIDVEPIERKIELAEEELKKLLKSAERNLSATNKCEDACNIASSSLGNIKKALNDINNSKNDEISQKETLHAVQGLEGELRAVEDKIEKALKERNKEGSHLSKSKSKMIDMEIKEMQKTAETLSSNLIDMKNDLGNSLHTWNNFNDGKRLAEEKLDELSKELEQVHKDRNGTHGRDYEDKLLLLGENEKRLERLMEQEMVVDEILKLANELNSEKPMEEAKVLKEKFHKQIKDLKNELQCNRKDADDHQKFKDELDSFIDMIETAEKLNKEFLNTPNTKEGLLQKQKILEKLNKLKVPSNCKLSDLKNLEREILNETAPDSKDQITSNLNNNFERFNDIFGDIENYNDDVKDTIAKLDDMDEKCEELSKNVMDINKEIEKLMKQPRNTIADKKKLDDELTALDQLIEERHDQINDMINQCEGLSDEAKEELKLKFQSIDQDLTQTHKCVNEELSQNKFSMEQQLKLNNSLQDVDSFISQLKDDLKTCSTLASNEKEIEENVNQLEKLESSLAEAEDMIENSKMKRNEAIPYLSKLELSRIDKNIDEMNNNANKLRDELEKTKKNNEDSLNKWNSFNISKEKVEGDINHISEELEHSHNIRKGIHGGDIDDKATLLKDNQNRFKSLNDRDKEIEEMIKLAKELNSDIPLKEAEELRKICQTEMKKLEKEINSNQKDLEDHHHFHDELNSFIGSLNETEDLNQKILDTPNTKEGLLRKQKLLEQLKSLKSPCNNKLKGLKNLEKNLLKETSPDLNDRISSDLCKECDRFNNIFGDIDNYNDDINETITKLEKIEEKCEELFNSAKDMNKDLEKSIHQPKNTIADKEEYEKGLYRFCQLMEQQRQEINDLKKESEGLSDETKDDMILKLEQFERDLEQAQKHVNGELSQNELSKNKQSELEDSLKNIDLFVHQLENNISQCSEPARSEGDIEEKLNKLQNLAKELSKTEDMISTVMKLKNDSVPLLSKSELDKMDEKIADLRNNANDLHNEISECKRNHGKELNKWNMFNDNRNIVSDSLDQLSKELEQSHISRKGIHGGDLSDKAILLQDNENRLESLKNQEKEIEKMILLAKELNSDIPIKEANELRKRCKDEIINLEKEIGHNQKDLEDHQHFQDELKSLEELAKEVEELNNEIQDTPNTREGLLKKKNIVEKLNGLKVPVQDKLKNLKTLQKDLLRETAPDDNDLISSEVNNISETFNRIFGGLDNYNDDINETISALKNIEGQCEEISAVMNDLHNELDKCLQQPRSTISDRDKLEKELNRLNRLLDQQKSDLGEMKNQCKDLNQEASEDVILRIDMIEKEIREMQQEVSSEQEHNKSSMKHQSELEDKLKCLDSFISQFEEDINEYSMPTNNESVVDENIKKMEKLKTQLPVAKALLEEIVKMRNQFDLPELCLKTCEDTEEKYFTVEEEIINVEKTLEKQKSDWMAFNTEKEDIENWVESINMELSKLSEKNQGIHGGKIEEKERLLDTYRNLLQDVINHESEVHALIDRSTPLTSSPNDDSQNRITNSLCKKYEKILETLKGIIQENQIDLEIHEKFETEVERFGSENNQIINELNDQIAIQPNNNDGLKKKIEIYDEIRKTYNSRAKQLSDLEKMKDDVLEHSSPKAYQNIEQIWDKIVNNFEKVFSKTSDNQAKLLAKVAIAEKTESDCQAIENRMNDIEKRREVCLLGPSEDMDAILNILRDLQYEFNDIEVPIDQIVRKSNELPMLKDKIDAIKKYYTELKGNVAKDIIQCENTNRDLHNLNSSIKNLKTWLDYNRSQFQEHVDVDNVDSKSLKSKLAKLKILRDDIAGHKVDLSRLQLQIEPLMKISNDISLKNSVDELSEEYKELHEQCQNFTDKYEKILKLMSKYESSRASILHCIDSNTQVLLKCSDNNVNNSQIRSKLLMIENLDKDLELSGQSKFIEAIQNGDELINELKGIGRNVIERQVNDLKSDWTEMCRQLNHLTNNLKTTTSRSEAFKETINKLTMWLNDIEHAGLEDSSAISHQCQRSPMDRRNSAQGERVKTLLAEVERHRPEFEKLSNMASEMANPSCDLENSQMQTRFIRLQNNLKEKAEKLDKQENDMENIKQDIENIEKWIFKTSMQIINENTEQNNPSVGGDVNSVLEQNNAIIQSVLSKESEVVRIHNDATALLENYSGQPSSTVDAFKEDLNKMESNFNNLKSSTMSKKTNLLDSLDKWENYQRLVQSTKEFLDTDLRRWWQDKEAASLQTPISNKDKENELREISDLEQKLTSMKTNIEKAAQECEGIPTKVTTSLSRSQTPGLSFSKTPTRQSPILRSHSTTPGGKVISRKNSMSAEQTKFIFEDLEDNISKLSSKKKELQEKYAEWNNFNREKAAYKIWFDNEVLKYKSILQSSPITTNIDAFQRSKLTAIQDEMKSKKPALVNLINKYADLMPTSPNSQDSLLKDITQDFYKIEKEIAKLLNREDKEVEADFTEDDSKTDILQEVLIPKLSLNLYRRESSNGYKSPDNLNRFTQTIPSKDEEKSKKHISANFGCQTPSTKMTQTQFYDNATDTTEYSRPSSRTSKRDQLSNIANKISEIRNELDKTKPLHNRRSSPTSLSSRRFRTSNQESVRRNMIPSTSRSTHNTMENTDQERFSGKTPYLTNSFLEITSPHSIQNNKIDDFVPIKDKWHDLEVFLQSTPRMSESLQKSTPTREFQVSYKPTSERKGKSQKRSKIYDDLSRLTKDSQDLRIMNEKLKK